MKTILLISLFCSFSLFAQNEENKRDSIPQSPSIKAYGCEEVAKPPLTKAYKDSVFNLHKIKIVAIEENELDEEIIEDYSMKGDPIIISASYPSGEMEMFKFVKNNFVYPVNEIPDIKGTVYVDFVVDTVGNIESIKIFKGLTPLIDKEALRVVGLFPNFSPQIVNGEKVKIHYTIPVKVNSNYAYKPIFYDAEFPGGVGKMNQFIRDSLNVSNCDLTVVSGTRVYAIFTVLKNGNITNIRIVKGISNCVDELVIEMIEKMPKWTPAEFEGQPLDSTFELPIQLEFR